MNERTGPTLAKWPFLLGDALLLGLAWWLLQHYPRPLPWLPLVGIIVCVAVGAWLAVTPFLAQFKADLQFAEADALSTAVTEINNVRSLANQISFATAQWQVVQEHSSRTVEEARGIAQTMADEARTFTEFMAKANDREKAHLKLEADKLRRAEQDWLQVNVALLDHAYALYRAGLRSGNNTVIAQLTHFQTACRELVRRIGLVPFDAKPGESFNEQAHQLPEPEGQVPADARISEVLATGFTFQGQLLRKAIVLVQARPISETADTTGPAPEPVALGQS